MARIVWWCRYKHELESIYMFDILPPIDELNKKQRYIDKTNFTQWWIRMARLARSPAPLAPRARPPRVDRTHLDICPTRGEVCYS